MNLKNILLTHQDEKRVLLSKTYIHRAGLGKARENLSNNLIKVILGPRRAGKSVFALECLRSTPFGYVNFDDERLLHLKNYDELLRGIQDVYGDVHHLLFDEIQNLENWELFVSRLQRRGYSLVLTGSNSQLLSGELATHLTGRHEAFSLLPFSFQEYLDAKKFPLGEPGHPQEKEGKILWQLDQYLQTGGYPEVTLQNVEAGSYLTSLFESILFKDIVRRYRIRFPQRLFDAAKFLLTNHSNEFTFTRLSKLLDFKSTHTIENYLRYLHEAFLLFQVPRYSTTLKETIKSAKKVYAFDTGLAQAIKFKTSPDLGRLIENVWALHLVRAKKEFYVYKTRDGKEVDFAVKEGLRITGLMQVCLDVKNNVTFERELRSLVKAGKETGTSSLTLITWDGEGKETWQGSEVKIVPLWKELLKEPELS